MGGCASRPKDLKGEAEAPEELPSANTTVEEVKPAEAEPAVEAKAETTESGENKEDPKSEEVKAEAKVEEEEEEEVAAPKVSDEEKPKEEATGTGSEEAATTTSASEEKDAEGKKAEVAAPTN